MLSELVENQMSYKRLLKRNRKLAIKDAKTNQKSRAAKKSSKVQIKLPFVLTSVPQSNNRLIVK